MQQTPLSYSRENGGYLQDPRLKRMRRPNVVKQAFHLWRKRLPLNSKLARVCYEAPGDIRLTNPGWKNQMSNVPHLRQVELIYQSGSSVSNFKVWPHLEEKYRAT